MSDSRPVILAVDDDPRVLEDRDAVPYETSVPGVFAAGDVRSGSAQRVAAAGGEGSATLAGVHAYLDAA